MYSHVARTALGTVGIVALLLSSVLVTVPRAQAETQANTLAGANASIDANLGSLNQQAADLGGQVSEVSAVIDRLAAEHDALVPVLQQKEELLRGTIKEAYMAGAPSSVEVLASNKTFSGLVGQQHYRDEMGSKTQQAAKELAAVKEQLNQKLAEAKEKRDGLVALQTQLQDRIDTAAAQAKAKEDLEKITQGKEEEYQKLLASQKQEELAPAAPANTGGGDLVRGNNTYTPGQCTWYVYNETGRGQRGNAGEWPGGGSRAVGSILIMPAGVGGSGGVGHVGVIVAISGSGITIRDMNWAGPFVVTTHTVPNSPRYRYL